MRFPVWDWLRVCFTVALKHLLGWFSSFLPRSKDLDQARWEIVWRRLMTATGRFYVALIKLKQLQQTRDSELHKKQGIENTWMDKETCNLAF